MSDTKEVKQWYDAHGIEYLPEDWGERDDTGESIGKQSSIAQRVGRDKVPAFDPEVLNELEGDEGGVVTLLWEQREDHAVLAALEDFFAPYLSWMPSPKRRVLVEYLLGRRSQEDIAVELGVSQQAVSKQLRAAVRWVVREIARGVRADAPAVYVNGDSTDDELAWETFNDYWLERFGTPWPLRG
jgi:hypothetical protein